MKKFWMTALLCGIVTWAGAELAWGRPGGGGGHRAGGGGGPRAGGRPGGEFRGEGERRVPEDRATENRVEERRLGPGGEHRLGPGGERLIGPGGERRLGPGGEHVVNRNLAYRNFDRYDWRHYYHHAGYGPFSPGWYADHPRAWWWAHPYGDAWAAATWAGLGGWLGYDAVAPIYGGYVDDGSTDDDTTEETTGEEEGATDEEQATAEEDSQSAEEASQLAEQGTNASVEKSEFMPLGVYQVASSEDGHPLALVQLAVSHEGVVRGDYIDLMSQATQPIFGAVNKETQQVAFRVGDQGQSTFETQLVGLTQDKTTALVHFASGATKRFFLTRATQPEGAESEQEATSGESATEPAAN